MRTLTYGFNECNTAQIRWDFKNIEKKKKFKLLINKNSVGNRKMSFKNEILELRVDFFSIFEKINCREEIAHKYNIKNETNLTIAIRFLR